MDHLDGIKDLFEEFSPANFYDTDNNEEKDFSNGSLYREEDWIFYSNLRDENPSSDPKRLTLFSGDRGPYRTENWEGKAPGDAFYVLSPTSDLVEEANQSGDYNDASYVILYRSNGGKILLCGDAHNKTWEHLLENHKSDISNVDLLIAPHHGRGSDRSFEFLDTVNPKMTFFGNAKSEHLAYDAWRSRGLEYITNNQAGSMIVDCLGSLKIYVTHETFARDRNAATYYSTQYRGWYLKEVTENVQQNSYVGLAGLLR